MMRIRLEYYDHNEVFALCLPKEGTIIKNASSHNVNDWYLVELDDTIEYQVQIKPPFKFFNTRYVLIRSRWVGHKIGEKEPTSVFILLVEEKQLPIESPIDIEQYFHVAWGMCETILETA